MIDLSAHKKLVESPAELPDFGKFETLFLDIESLNVTQDIIQSKNWHGMYPFKGDRIAGVAVTVDECEDSWYIPIRHVRFKEDANLPVENVMEWFQALVDNCKRWVNHNIVFDATFAAADGIVIPPSCRLVDTLTQSKMVDSDRLGHGLKDLNVAWLKGDNETEDRVKAFLSEIKSKNYAECPADIMGTYACEDVLINRKLLKFIDANMPPEMSALVETEIDLTSVLFDMEMHGLQINRRQCEIESVRCLRLLINTATEIEQISDREWTNSHDCIHDILVNQFNLPILATIKERDEDGYEVDTGRSTFDKNSLPLYQVHPKTQADPTLKRLIDLIQLYRKEQQFQSLFLDSFLDLCDDNQVIHPTYNQIVRTGRMSSRRPNAQQQNERSKALIHPRPGMAFLKADYSQVEYRLIVHYVKDEDAIAAYNEDPSTDFHKWVADMMHVDRSAGKTLNFGMAYGAGKKRVTTGLISNPLIIAEIGAEIASDVEEERLSEDAMNEAFQLRCGNRASEVYDLYHERFPGIKRLSGEAAFMARKRGWVKNLYGRRRHLPSKASRKAFNSIVQGGASDIAKEAMVKSAPRFNGEMRNLGITIAAQVHDEILFEGPEETMRNPATHRMIFEMLENPSVAIRVPIVADMGFAMRSWADAGADDREESVDGELICGPISRK